MPQPTTSIRTATKTRLLDLLGDDVRLDKKQIGRIEPGEPKDRMLYLGTTTGVQDDVAIKAGRRRRDDEFTIELFLESRRNGKTPVGAEDDVTLMFAVVEDILADNVTLGALAGVMWAGIGQVDGPNPFLLGDEGYGAAIRAEIVVRTRLV